MITLNEYPVGWVALNELPQALRMHRMTLDRRIANLCPDCREESFSKRKIYLRTKTVCALVEEITQRAGQVQINRKELMFIERPTGFVSKGQVPQQLGLTEKQYRRVLNMVFAEHEGLRERYEGNGKRWDVSIADLQLIVNYFAGKSGDEDEEDIPIRIV